MKSGNEWRKCNEPRDIRHHLRKAISAVAHLCRPREQRQSYSSTVPYFLTTWYYSKLFYLLFDSVGTLLIWQAVMSTNPPYPPGNNQPPYPTQQPMSQYPPPAMMNYGSGYPPPSNQAAYPTPVETVPSNPAYPPPPTYESAVGTGGKPTASNAYGNYSYQTEPIPPAQPPPPTYSSPDVEYGASRYADTINFSDKSIRLGMVCIVLFC